MENTLINRNNTLNNDYNKFIKALKYLLVFALSTIPTCIYIFSLKNIDTSYIFPIFLNSHLFVSFYLFCFTVLFHLIPFNRKVILMTFLSFLLVSLIAVFSNISFNYIYMPPIGTADFQILFNRAIFFTIIFFIILMLSYNSFDAVNTDKISDFFTVFGDTFLWFVIINTASSTVLTILTYLLIIVGFSITALFESSTDIGFIIAKLVICFTIFIYGFIPFLAYYIYCKTKSVISIYVSRAFLVITLFCMFIMLFLMLPYESRPYNNRVVYVLYNCILAFTIINLLFTRMDKKSNIFIKAMYLIVPLFAMIFDLLTITATIYRIVNFGLTPTKLTLIILNIIFLIHLIFILASTIVSFMMSFKNRETTGTFDIVINNKPMIFIYVYLLFSFVVCFVLPIIYIN